MSEDKILGTKLRRGKTVSTNSAENASEKCITLAGRITNRGGVFTVPTLTTKLLSVPRASPHASFVIEGITPRYATNHPIEKTGKSQ